MEAKSQCVKSRTRRWDWTGLGKPVNHAAQPPALTCNYSATVIRAHCQSPEWWENQTDRREVVKEKSMSTYTALIYPTDFSPLWPHSICLWVLLSVHTGLLTDSSLPASPSTLSHPEPQHIHKRNGPITLCLKAIELCRAETLCRFDNVRFSRGHVFKCPGLRLEASFAWKSMEFSLNRPRCCLGHLLKCHL